MIASPPRRGPGRIAGLLIPVLLVAACESDDHLNDNVIVEGTCVAPADDPAPGYLTRIGCRADFDVLASAPLDSSIPGARSAKVVLDRADDGALYFQNSVRYPIHHDFASAHLSGGDLPVVPTLGEFNTTEYFTPDRRFILGAVTYYEAPDLWALELSPYDTASVEMITALYRAVKAAAYFGPGLRFHPSSEAGAALAAGLPADVAQATTEEIYAATDYQPLTLATGIGRLHFATAEALTTEYVSYQDIMVLDQAPNDISACQGLITERFQTPLSHVNVLSANRHTPNMGLRGALTHETLRALEGQLVELTVSSTEWTVREVTEAEAEAFWEANAPEPVVLPVMDLDATGLYDVEDIVAAPGPGETLRDAIKAAIPAFGGKTAHYSVLTQIGEDVPIKKAFAVPMVYYDQFMRDGGFHAQLTAWLADESFRTDPAVREARLVQMGLDMESAPVSEELQRLLAARIAAEHGTHRMRFRTSTNSEDLDGFPCAGCYESHTGDPTDWEDVLLAIRRTWASAWLFRTFEERAYYGIDHLTVGMSLLVHPNFEDEEANGVAVTSNPYDVSGLDPAFYVNVQTGGDAEVVAPPPGVTSDQFLYYFSVPNQPITYLSHSNLVPAGTAVLTGKQIHALGVALHAIHSRMSAAYGPAAGNTGWYAMDVEFKLDDEADPTAAPTLYIKQARPYPGRSHE
jgi:hypothetical protein